MAEHDVTLTSFVANLSHAAKQFLDTLCKMNVREGTESFATISTVILEILREDFGGGVGTTPTRSLDLYENSARINMVIGKMLERCEIGDGDVFPGISRTGYCSSPT